MYFRTSLIPPEKVDLVSEKMEEEEEERQEKEEMVGKRGKWEKILEVL